MKIDLTWLENWHVSNAVKADLERLQALARNGTTPEIDKTIMHLHAALDKLEAARAASAGREDLQKEVNTS